MKDFEGVLPTKPVKDPVIIYPLPGRIYKHYKGGYYQVITLSTHSETGAVEVVYRSMLFGSIHHRPLAMWFEMVDYPNPDNNGVSNIVTRRFKEANQREIIELKNHFKI
jgi:hypothetical protein